MAFKLMTNCYYYVGRCANVQMLLSLHADLLQTEQKEKTPDRKIKFKKPLDNMKKQSVCKGSAASSNLFEFMDFSFDVCNRTMPSSGPIA